MPKSKSTRELFAFWSYDQFPYVLGGTMTMMDDKGLVETEEYEVGSKFKPVKILPLCAGLALYAKLNLLKLEYEAEQDRVLRAAKQKLEDLL